MLYYVCSDLYGIIFLSVLSSTLFVFFSRISKMKSNRSFLGQVSNLYNFNNSSGQDEFIVIK